MPNDPSPQPLTEDGPASDRDKADMIAARREIQAVLDGRLPMDNAAYSAAIVMVLWKAGWRPRHLSTSMDRCDIADGWWRLGRGWRQRFEDAQSEADRLRAENTALAAKLAEVRELRRAWFQNAEVHRGKADSMQGLTEVERAELRQGAAEMGYCARQVGLALGPTPEEEPDFVEKDLDRHLRVDDEDRSALGLDQDGSST